MRPGGGGAYNAPRYLGSQKSQKHETLGWVDQHKSSFWCKFCDLGSTFQGPMTISMQNVRHFLSNVQGIALASLAPKLRQMASICEKQTKQHEVGQLDCGLRLDFRAQVNHFRARGKILPKSSTVFQTLRFSTITSELFVLEQEIWHHRVSLVRYPKVPQKAMSKLDLPLNMGSHVRLGQVKVGNIVYHSIRGQETKTSVPMVFVYHLLFKSYGQKSNLSIGLGIMGRVEY